MKQLSALVRDFNARFPSLPVMESEPLARHCSFRIGGPCAAMLFPSSAEEISGIAELLRSVGEKPFLMGNGTNLLFPDEGLDRIVIRLGDGFSAVERTSAHTLSAECGVTLSRLASRAASLGLAGLEFAHGIPGTLGGAVSMNAGAYGGEMRDVIRRVTYLDAALVLRETENAGLSYRHSRFSDTEDIILSADVVLSDDDPAVIQERMRVLMEKRRASQPLDMPSAGSTFKRPVGGYAAALIDRAGLKGFSLGGAQVSEKHAGFVINRGGATCLDVLRLMEHIQSEVLRTSGIALEPEVRIISD